MAESSNSVINTLFNEIINASGPTDRERILAEADISKTQKKALRRKITKWAEDRRKEEEEEGGEGEVPAPTDDEDEDESGDEGDDFDIRSLDTKPSSKPGTKQPKAKPKTEVKQSEVDKFWKDLESMDINTLIDPQILDDFRYVGFDPNTILRTIITKGKAAKKSSQEIRTDIASMCVIAIMKGSITDNNVRKMSDAGKRTYSKLEETYGLKRGGTKGVDPSVATIARVGAAFPGAMMQVLLKNPDLAKKFSGPFSSKVLPSYLRHQSAAAIIPDSCNSKLKDFLLGLITAYTSDQSKTISRSKDSASELFDRQQNFVSQTNSAMFPSETVRKSLFKHMTLENDYDSLVTVATAIKKVDSSFNVLSLEDLKTMMADV
jgi:hypothetical protein